MWINRALHKYPDTVWSHFRLFSFTVEKYESG